MKAGVSRKLAEEGRRRQKKAEKNRRRQKKTGEAF